ncbi:MAG: NAD(P)/FAD-dependent oxidoreductase [Ferrimicrobium sp.]
MKASKQVVVVGGGVVGLSVAWHLQRLGVEVTLVERSRIAGGASWGNAGWISPGLATPLPEPVVLHYGLRNLFDRRSPLYVPPRVDGSLLRFLVSFARHCSEDSWKQAMQSLLPLNERAIDSFVAMAEAGVGAPTVEAPIVAAFRSRGEADDLEREIAAIRAIGGVIDSEELPSDVLRERYRVLGEGIHFALQLNGQRYIDAGAFCLALVESIRSGGAQVLEGSRVLNVHQEKGHVEVNLHDGSRLESEAAVIATGAWAGYFARHLGVRIPQVAGRGYSFFAPCDVPVASPFYLPMQRIACTPRGNGLRVAGTMELAGAEDPLDLRRIEVMMSSIEGLLHGVHLEESSETWVGPRPVTADGLPIIGPTKYERIWLTAGHGMWGVTHGPITGDLVARSLVSGSLDPLLTPFSPTRRART